MEWNRIVMLKESEIIKEIIDLLSREKLNIQSQCKIGLFDDNKYWENIIRNLLNAIYGYELVNLNQEKTNYPGIDLGDAEIGLGIQITETKTSAKVTRSLDKVLENEVYLKYPKFSMFILGDKQQTYTVDMAKYQGKINFCPESDILDFQDLISAINEMNREEMQDILDYLRSEFETRETNEARKNIMYLLSYLENSWKWIELAKERGPFLTDVYRCNNYIERCDAISSHLTQEEYSELYALLTEINQVIDYMEEGNEYLRQLRIGKHRSGLIRYSDSHTCGLSHSIMVRAESILEKKGIYETLKSKI
ncbi:MAG: SMEK domain-containing protein [Lachnospiraceae bacterium]|nr:SMEK domain-containing protein [Lachnospiraceae bacterium]